MDLMIARLGNSAPVAYACQELRRYFKKMSPLENVAVLAAEKYEADRTATLWVGEDPAFETQLPAVSDRALDDGIYLKVQGGAGIVTGTNPRSVLIAAYRLLRENGCAFLHPGKDGERIPEKCLSEVSADVCESAANRHRGVCIEGAVSYSHVLNMIEFMPKLGMNAYFFQFFVPRTFFDRWYGHQLNPDYPAASMLLDREQVVQMRKTLVEEIKRRGLLYHAVGHGWTCEPFGIEGDCWESKQPELPDATREMLAMVNGKRELWDGVALNTNLCYGNPEARRAVTNAIADYCAANPEVDYLHFWLADGTNNHCECPLCRDTLPSDFYVQMLNELDEILTDRGISTRIVFLIYVDLLWAPELQKIAHPDRFVLMFAPITRTYSAPFLPDQMFEGELAPYDRNRNIMPSSVAENVARLRQWQSVFDGDGFDFDYHFMWDHMKDFGYYNMAKILMQDMQNLRHIGLNGMISCQCQRVFFPTALGMHAMAQGLWSAETGFEELAKRYFEDAYGGKGEAVRGYLSSVSEYFDAPYIRREKPVVDEEQARKYDALGALVKDFMVWIDGAQAEESDPGISGELHVLKLHGELTLRMAAMLAQCARGATEDARAAWKEARSYARRIEPEVQERLDVMELIHTYRKSFRGLGIFED